MPRHKAKKNAAQAPERDERGEMALQTNAQTTAPANGRGVVLCRGGFPYLETRVFAVFRTMHEAAELAERFRKAGTEAWHEPALPTDFAGRIRPEGAR